MKRSLALLLASLLLVFGRTACGREDTPKDQTDGSVSEDLKDAADDVGDAARDGLDDAGNAIEDGADRIEDAVDGDGVPNKSHSMLDGVSYEEMLRNGKVHDTDGDLTDHENAVSGSAY